MPLSFSGTIGLFLICLSVNAQSFFEGKVFELETSIPLEKVKVDNINSGKSTFSDSAGRFKIEAKASDVIAFTLYSYLPDTAFLINLNFKEFYLQPKSHQLSEVAITGVKINAGSMVDTEFHGQTVRYQYNEDGSRKGGLVFRLWYWNKDSKKERRSQRRLKDLEIMEEIDRIFNPLFIAEHTPLKGSELLDFRDLYRPPIKLYKSAGFNIFLYLNDSYKEFKSLDPKKRKLPPLEPFKP